MPIGMIDRIMMRNYSRNDRRFIAKLERMLVNMIKKHTCARSKTYIIVCNLIPLKMVDETESLATGLKHI
jgi:hypothetical protein